MINCFLLGEVSILETVRLHLQRNELVRVVGCSCDANEASRFVINFKPKIVFADAKLLSTEKDILLQIAKETNIIYVSNGVNIAYEAFEMMAFDYLLSPITPDRLEKSINKYIRSSIINYHATAQQYPLTDKIVDSFFIKTDSKGQKETLVKCADILYIKAMQNYVMIYMTNNRQFISHHTMREMEENLPIFHFQRIHKSYIVNYQRISSVNGNTVILDHSEQMEFVIGNSFKKTFFERKNQSMIKKTKDTTQRIYFSDKTSNAKTAFTGQQ